MGARIVAHRFWWGAVFQYLGPAGIGLGGGAGGSPLAPGETLEHVWTARLMERDGTIDLRIGLYGLLLDPGTATLVYEHAAAGAPVRTNRGPQLWRGTLRRRATLEVAR